MKTGHSHDSNTAPPEHKSAVLPPDPTAQFEVYIYIKFCSFCYIQIFLMCTVMSSIVICQTVKFNPASVLTVGMGTLSCTYACFNKSHIFLYNATPSMAEIHPHFYPFLGSFLILTYAVEQNYSWKTSSSSTTQEIPSILWSLNVHMILGFISDN